MSTAVSPAMTAGTRSSSYRAASGETPNLVRETEVTLRPKICDLWPCPRGESSPEIVQNDCRTVLGSAFSHQTARGGGSS